MIVCLALCVCLYDLSQSSRFIRASTIETVFIFTESKTTSSWTQHKQNNYFPIFSANTLKAARWFHISHSLQVFSVRGTGDHIYEWLKKKRKKKALNKSLFLALWSRGEFMPTADGVTTVSWSGPAPCDTSTGSLLFFCQWFCVKLHCWESTCYFESCAAFKSRLDYRNFISLRCEPPTEQREEGEE